MTDWQRKVGRQMILCLQIYLNAFPWHAGATLTEEYLSDTCSGAFQQSILHHNF